MIQAYSVKYERESSDSNGGHVPPSSHRPANSRKCLFVDALAHFTQRRLGSNLAIQELPVSTLMS